MTTQTIQERLRACAAQVRSSSVRLSDFIPLLQEAADELDKQEAELDNLYRSASHNEGNWVPL